MSTTKNIIANLASRLWGFVSLYLFANIYIRLIGIESYGIISLYTLIFGIISFIDAGLSSAVNREFAKEVPPAAKLRVLYYLEKIYVLICLVAAVAIYLSASYLAKKWLNKSSIPTATLIVQIRLIAIGVAFQMITTIYFGALMGLQKQVWCNSAQIVWNLFKTAGGAAVLYFIAPSLVYFFEWQIVCNIIYLLVIRKKIVSEFAPTNRKLVCSNAQLPEGLWKYIAGTAGISILSAISVQADKIITSKMLSLSDFGYYSLASLIAQVPLLIAIPVTLALFPRIIRSFAGLQSKNADELIRNYALLITCIVFPAGMVICFFNQSLFSVWVSVKGNATHEFGKLKYTVIFLSIGNTFLSLHLMPFHLLLAKGKTRYTIYQGVVQLCMLIAGLYFFSTRYGLNGIGVPWMVVNFGGYIFLILVVRKYLSASTVLTMVKDVAKASTISLVITWTAYLFSRNFSGNYLYIIFACIAGVCSLGVSLAVILKKGDATSLYIKRLISR